MQGFSVQWWKNKHNGHHAVPNLHNSTAKAQDGDPDIDTMPVLAWSVKQAVTNAAREGARILILQYGQGLNCLEIDCSSAESVKTAAMNTIKFHLSGSGLNTEDSAVEINFIRQQVHSESDYVTSEPLVGEMISGDLVGIAIKYKYVSTVQALIANQDSDNTIDMLTISKRLYKQNI